MTVPFIAIVGATGTGKSALALDLAAALARRGKSAEIVNADAMQLYRGMDIGTAKLTLGERQGIPHHLLDVLAVTDEASVAEYQRLARAVVTAILERDAVPILVGGSGLYVSATLFDFRFPGTDAVVRSRLENELAETGPAALHTRLGILDPRAAKLIDPGNGRRIVRALEILELTGAPVAARLPERPVPWLPHRIIHLTMNRALLVQRLDARVEKMWLAGLPHEVRELIPLGIRDGITASRAIGYAQALAEIDGHLSRAQAIAGAQAFTRRYARKQVSWFGRYRNAVAVDATTELEDALQLVLQPGF